MHFPFSRTASKAANDNRRGTILVLSAICMIMVMAMVAFSVDLGYIATAKAQLQNASDAAALGGALELYGGLGPGTNSYETVANTARTAATTVAASNPAAGSPSVYVPSGDIQLGRRVWDENGSYTDSWNTAPYNLIKVEAHRDRTGSSYNDGPISTFFARVLGHSEVEISAETKVVVHAAAGFRVSETSSSTANILPITYDLESWNAILAGSGGTGDNYCWTGSGVTGGSDGINEFDLYPTSNNTLPSGNRGTLDLGTGDNSTSDLIRQIYYGMNGSDMAVFNGELEPTSAQPAVIDGDTGISAAIKDSLTNIVGQTRALPIFSNVAAPGDNCQYTIVKFVGVRVMFVRLTGGNKKLIVQPGPVMDATAIPATSSSSYDYVFLPPRLTQ